MINYLLTVPMTPRQMIMIYQEDIEVYSLGAMVTLTKSEGDYTHNTETNAIELTSRGREILFNFPYANPQNIRQVPRVNYTLKTQHGITGYAIVVPGVITNTLTKTKTFFSELADRPNFTADVSFETTQDVNNDSDDGSLFSGKAGNNFLICDDFLGMLLIS